MNHGRTRFLDLALLTFMVVGVPILTGLLMAVAEDPPVEALVVLVGVFAMGLVWAGMSSLAKFDELRGLGWATKAARRTVLTAAPAVRLPAMAGGISAQSGPLTLTAVGGAGGCPRGFQAGDKWLVGRDGQLSPRLCTAALDVLEPVLAGFKQNDHASAERVSCTCPARGYQLTFAVSRPATAA